MEFKEFTNPLEEDYDIKSSLSEEDNKSNLTVKENNSIKEQFNELWFYAGAPELYELVEFGITENDFTNPDKKTLENLLNYIKKYNIELPEKNNKKR